MFRRANVDELITRRDLKRLLKAMRHADPSVRASAVRGVALCADREAVAPLVAMLADADRSVRDEAIRALGRLGDLQAVEALIGLLDAEEDYGWTRASAAQALVELGAPAAIDPLLARPWAQTHRKGPGPPNVVAIRRRVYPTCIVANVTVSFALLGLLEEASRHGYDLKRSYDELFGAVEPIRFGQVYRTLSQLERDGRIEVVGVEAGSGPDRKRYAVTREGVIDLDGWLGEPEEPRPHRQSVLFTKVVVALLSGRSAKRFLDAQRAMHVKTMKALTTARRSAATTQDAVLADFQLFHLEADLRWIDHTEARLAALAKEVRDVRDPARR